MSKSANLGGIFDQKQSPIHGSRFDLRYIITWSEELTIRGTILDRTPLQAFDL